jgi:Ca2+-binding RTX toxin-like protein
MTADITVDLASGASADAGAGEVQIAAFAAGTVIEHAVTGDGDDTLIGNDGDNRLSGMRGADLIDGGAGEDDLLGHFGNDTLTGGEGADVFHFALGHGSDVILDFDQQDLDLVSLSGFAETSFAELRFEASGTDQLLSLSSGDSLTFANVGDLVFSADDFVFENTWTV